MLRSRDAADKLSSFWRLAGQVLGIKVNAPFELRTQGRVHLCVAHLPDFGGGQGTVIMGTSPPDFAADPIFIADAEDCGYHWSFLNTEEYSEFDIEIAKEALRDWGFAGDPSFQPSWIVEL